MISLSTRFVIPNAQSSPSSHFRSFSLRFARYFLLGLALLLGASSAPAQTPTVLHSFGSFTGDGVYPGYGALMLDCNNNLWGTTEQAGGPTTWGTIYELPYPYTSYKGAVITFPTQGYDGERPYYGLTLDQSKCAGYGTVFYGTTVYGGANNQGTVFKYDDTQPAGQKYHKIHDFSIAVDGAYPYGGVTIDSNGNLWGTSKQGTGTGYCGVVWELQPSGNSSTLLFKYLFPTGNGTGCSPQAPLTFDSSGDLWGTTMVTDYNGNQATGYGTVFEFVNSGGTLASTPKPIHVFSNNTDGRNPTAALVMDSNGSLYGTTYGTADGGDCNSGTVYEITSPGMTPQYQVIYVFPGEKYNSLGVRVQIPGDGYAPTGGVVVDSSGNVDGVTYWNLPNALGTLFKLSNSPGVNVCALGLWSEDIVHPFAGGATDGAHPDNTLILSNGTLYGTAINGGTNNEGVVYSIPVP